MAKGKPMIIPINRTSRTVRRFGFGTLFSLLCGMALAACANSANSLRSVPFSQVEPGWDLLDVPRAPEGDSIGYLIGIKKDGSSNEIHRVALPEAAVAVAAWPERKYEGKVDLGAIARVLNTQVGARGDVKTQAQMRFGRVTKKTLTDFQIRQKTDELSRIGGEISFGYSKVCLVRGVAVAETAEYEISKDAVRELGIGNSTKSPEGSAGVSGTSAAGPVSVAPLGVSTWFSVVGKDQNILRTKEPMEVAWRCEELSELLSRLKNDSQPWPVGTFDVSAGDHAGRPFQAVLQHNRFVKVPLEPGRYRVEKVFSNAYYGRSVTNWWVQGALVDSEMRLVSATAERAEGYDVNLSGGPSHEHKVDDIFVTTSGYLLLWMDDYFVSDNEGYVRVAITRLPKP
jgi:hypothetical protein